MSFPWGAEDRLKEDNREQKDTFIQYSERERCSEGWKWEFENDKMFIHIHCCAYKLSRKRCVWICLQLSIHKYLGVSSTSGWFLLKQIKTKCIKCTVILSFTALFSFLSNVKYGSNLTKVYKVLPKVSLVGSQQTLVRWQRCLLGYHGGAIISQWNY